MMWHAPGRVLALAIAASSASALVPRIDANQERKTPDNRQDQQIERTVLAIMRRDGVMFPFAAFNKDKWEVPWPLNLADVEIPSRLEALREKWWGMRTPSEWWFTPPDGAP